MTYQPSPTKAFSTGATTVRPRGDRQPRAVGLTQQVERLLDVDLPEWYENALCAQSGPETFFPHKGGSPKEAKKVCGRCPVVEECLAYALANNERFGVWGGKTEHERRRLKLRAGSPTPSTGIGVDRALVVADYKDPSLSVADIAAKYGIAKKTVSQWAKAAGLEPRRRGGDRRSPTYKDGAS